MKQKSFWMVWNWNAGGFPPRCKHDTRQSAEIEAERLARECRGNTFVVLEAVCARRADDLIRIDFDHDSDIPF